MHHENIFMYFFYFDGELYSQHAWIQPELWRRVLARFGLFPYSQKHLDEIEGTMLQGAIASIDALKKLSPKERKQKKETVKTHDKLMEKMKNEKAGAELIQKVAPATDEE